MTARPRVSRERTGATMTMSTKPANEARAEIAERLPPVEDVAAKVHEAWLHAKKVGGTATRRSESGEELMVPYDQLSDAAKELDRTPVRAVYDAIAALAPPHPAAPADAGDAERVVEALAPFAKIA